MSSLFERLGTEVGMTPAAILATPAIRTERGGIRIAESLESHGVQVATAGLERRIRAMAARWQYSSDEMTEALEGAKRDPAVWVKCCLADEQYAATLDLAGLPLVQE